MDPLQLEQYYIELGELIQVNKMCQGNHMVMIRSKYCVLTLPLSCCRDMANLRLL